MTKNELFPRLGRRESDAFVDRVQDETERVVDRVSEVDRIWVVVLVHNVERQEAITGVFVLLDHCVGGEFIVRAVQGEKEWRERRVAVNEVGAIIDLCRAASFRYRFDEGPATGQEVAAEIVGLFS